MDVYEQEEKRPVRSHLKVEMEMFEESARLLQEKYGYSSDDLLGLMEKVEVFVPIGIFSSTLSPLSSLVMYLHEKRRMPLSEVAVSLGRSYRAVWGAYKGLRKSRTSPKIVPSEFSIPLSAFSRKLSILEAVVVFLRDEYGASLKETASQLGRDPRTVWTLYDRAKKKSGA